MSKSEWIWIERELYKSKAFSELFKRSRFGVPALIWFLHKRQFAKKSKAKPGRESSRPIKNNGEITFTYSEAKNRLGISKTTFSKVLSTLNDVGFIDFAHVGGGYARDSNLFSISSRWRLYGTPDFQKVEREKNDNAAKNSGYRRVRQKRERERQNIVNHS